MEGKQTRRGFLKSIAAAIGGLVIASKAPAKQSPNTYTLKPSDLPGHSHVALPPGYILPYCGKTPEGWLECNGQAVPKSQYRELFSAIGTTFGGGNDEFNLPDLRGRVTGPITHNWSAMLPAETYIIKAA